MGCILEEVPLMHITTSFFEMDELDRRSMGTILSDSQSLPLDDLDKASALAFSILGILSTRIFKGWNEVHYKLDVCSHALVLCSEITIELTRHQLRITAYVQPFDLYLYGYSEVS